MPRPSALPSFVAYAITVLSIASYLPPLASLSRIALLSAPCGLPPFLMIPFRVVESNIKPNADLLLYVIHKLFFNKRFDNHLEGFSMRLLGGVFKATQVALVHVATQCGGATVFDGPHDPAVRKG